MGDYIASNKAMWDERARLGARMTGLDFSSAALALAWQLAERTCTDIDFHEAEVYDAVEALDHPLDRLLGSGLPGRLWRSWNVNIRSASMRA